MESIISYAAADHPFKLGVPAAPVSRSRINSSPSHKNWRGLTKGTSSQDTELILWNSGHDMSSANSLSFALESSLKLWQVRKILFHFCMVLTSVLSPLASTLFPGIL